jgi:hypothetical protein
MHLVEVLRMERVVLLYPRLCAGGGGGESHAPGGGSAHGKGGAPLTYSVCRWWERRTWCTWRRCCAWRGWCSSNLDCVQVVGEEDLVHLAEVLLMERVVHL